MNTIAQIIPITIPSGHGDIGLWLAIAVVAIALLALAGSGSSAERLVPPLAEYWRAEYWLRRARRRHAMLRLLTGAVTPGPGAEPPRQADPGCLRSGAVRQAPC
jgi:hypothetical protein